MRPLRDVLISLKWGEAFASSGIVCTPIVTSLMKAASEMGFADLTKALGDFADVLRTTTDGEGLLGAGARNALLEAYARLSAQMPEVFALDVEQGRREAIIVQ